MTSLSNKSDLLDDAQIAELIEKYKSMEPADVTLKLAKLHEKSRKFIVSQISGNQKSRLKLPFLYNKKGIIFPKKVSVEQCSSQITAEFKAGLVGGKNALDLTSGFGVDSAFLAGKFDKITLVEKDAELLESVRNNYEILKIQNASFVNDSAENYLINSDVEFDLIYLDPDRRQKKVRAILLEDMEPNVLKLKSQLLKKAKKVMVKLPPMLDISKLISQIPEISHIHVLSVNNECKEILILMSNNNFDGIIHCHELGKDSFSYDFNIHSETEVRAEITGMKKYAFLPNTSLTKAGAFNSISSDLGVSKISANTHIYTSEKFVDNFPGKKYEVLDVLPYKKGQLDSSYNVILKNFPHDLKSVLKKLKIKNGGETSLLLYRNKEEKAEMCLCKLLPSQ